ncbi:CheY-like chemotaxis protein/HPt (histidine-containing phosphotransfer) domain-containing protein [Xanthomonas arboricola]|jgi:CheY-like chemotaxis protein/HPt (histidine-containing phosphotransfer) domain-containing protein|uniref:CheY-like chemotaxis protein/HPt (Histidine-containing phosphotransfer) domain-containing protein n=1 Tax=Xanthomonas arboricola TaxID=56448 RepID=A0AB73GRS7_9XANT|nr:MULTISPECIES: response regulator [Xanthomonas]AKC77580.1 transcriptional regulator [Xanthomonas arboricola]KPN07922.1 transcriptional regulator [Xanthomonas arboricola]MBB3760834.1 CheY-like chemotaxis protein/HPt (histidine-containing phosphotransfer) domain-containing protein [Xanthomonas arboricola]MBB3798283.1 CheY-like chemotaxis protein/HPt (histidine-containing phosphotransfer) domain-containing protein [Xanthomonas arboricola]MBB4596611.1 CheY-like chemotaxis protein/HPt (histidine-
MNMATRQEPQPRLLLVEDDPISRGFLQAVLEGLPAHVDCADSLSSALDRARARRHDLWLIDVNLPDGTGSGLLRALRLLHPDVPALAHTADTTTAMQRSLQSDGFLELLVKPLTSERLLQAVRRGLARGRYSVAPVGVVDIAASDWDEAAALSALNGQQHHLNALRELFLAELPGTRDAVDSALQVSDDQALRSHLHRLQASCGFVGAARLAGAVRLLRGDPHSSTAQTQFHAAVAALLH